MMKRMIYYGLLAIFGAALAAAVILVPQPQFVRLAILLGVAFVTLTYELKHTFFPKH